MNQMQLKRLFNEATAEITRLRAERDAMREALQQLVTDYEDVPGPYDAEGQAVFAKARAALAPSPAGREERHEMTSIGDKEPD